ncbi:hypothetical protein Mpt1_c08450 [Candidatus Methanoplasma termitum]|uniref:Uncharacterized protein n=1 Tax=Candidatus Methanoplasma termitum TaxID=1577791 RepID=A0A0A7LGU7_9ARCH|nr:hypothetical protein [Candidatus Methanoplasma termitum]AIZ56721.1 hypothetical protein Mpt1_c08450 [Candidatus Methanoplasma termitum]
MSIFCEGIKDEDGRLPKQFGDFAEGLVMYLLGQRGMSVALIDHVGADLIAAERNNPEKRYAISVKGRNIPDTESKGFNFSQDNIDKLRRTAETFGLIPAVAFVFVDKFEKVVKIRILLSTLDKLQEQSKNEKIEFINDKVKSGGIYIKYEKLAKSGKDSHLDQIRNCGFIDYTEFELNRMDTNKSPFACDEK